jgi:hypothetical protein
LAFVVVEDLDGFGELCGPVWVVADLVEHAPALELCEYPLTGAAQPGMEPVELLLPLGFALGLNGVATKSWSSPS